MFRAPKGRKRQFQKNRCVLITRRARSADTLAGGAIRGKFNGEIVARVAATGIESRESFLDCECRGAGQAGLILLMKPGGARHVYDCCRDLLRFFGIEWCLQARFVNCRFTVAEVLAKNRGVRLNECVRDSYDETTQMWMIQVPFGNLMFDPSWSRWCETTVTADFSSGEKAHTLVRARMKYNKRERAHNDLPFSNSRHKV